jgi:hypothetical protein
MAARNAKKRAKFAAPEPSCFDTVADLIARDADNDGCEHEDDSDTGTGR